MKPKNDWLKVYNIETWQIYIKRALKAKFSDKKIIFQIAGSNILCFSLSMGKRMVLGHLFGLLTDISIYISFSWSFPFRMSSVNVLNPQETTEKIYIHNFIFTKEILMENCIFAVYDANWSTGALWYNKPKIVSGKLHALDLSVKAITSFKSYWSDCVLIRITTSLIYQKK